MVAYGDNDLVKIYERKQFAEVDSYYIGVGYNSLTLLNDIALIKLKSPLNFTDSVQPACLPTQNQGHYDGVLKVKIIFSFRQILA